jgi:hypothetical protein
VGGGVKAGCCCHNSGPVPRCVGVPTAVDVADSPASPPPTIIKMNSSFSSHFYNILNAPQ